MEQKLVTQQHPLGDPLAVQKMPSVVDPSHVLHQKIQGGPVFGDVDEYLLLLVPAFQSTHIFPVQENLGPVPQLLDYHLYLGPRSAHPGAVQDKAVVLIHHLHGERYRAGNGLAKLVQGGKQGYRLIQSHLTQGQLRCHLGDFHRGQ